MNLNQKMVKKLLVIMGIIILALLLILVVLLFTRSDDENGVVENDTSPQQPTAQRVVLEYWGLWEDEIVMQPLIEKYEDQNPHVQIKYTRRTFTDYENQLYTRLAQGITEGPEGAPAPDIVKINNTWLPKFEKFLVPMPENIMSTSEYAQKFFPTCREDFTGSDGRIYAIPVGIDGLAVFYNKELLSQEGVAAPPSDWDSFIELAKRLTVQDTNGRIVQSGVAMGTANNISHAADIIAFLLIQNNADVISRQQTLTADLTSPNAEEALQFYKDFAEVHKLWSSDLHLDLDMFFAGDLAMFFAPSWRTFDIIEAASHIEFDVAPLPQLEANDPINYAMYWGESVSRSSRNQEEAWKFLKFLSEEENIKQFHAESSKIRAFGQPYPLTNLQRDLLGERYVGAIMEMAPTMKAWEMSQNPEVEGYLKQALENPRQAENNINNLLHNL